MPGGRHGLQNRRLGTLCRGVGSIPTLSAISFAFSSVDGGSGGLPSDPDSPVGSSGERAIPTQSVDVNAGGDLALALGRLLIALASTEAGSDLSERTKWTSTHVADRLDRRLSAI